MITKTFKINDNSENNEKDKKFRKIVSKFRNQNQGILFRDQKGSKTVFEKKTTSLDVRTYSRRRK